MIGAVMHIRQHGIDLHGKTEEDIAQRWHWLDPRSKHIFLALAGFDFEKFTASFPGEKKFDWVGLQVSPTPFFVSDPAVLQKVIDKLYEVE
jgi:hypothetical protein